MSRVSSFTDLGNPERRQNFIMGIILLIVLAFVVRLVYVQAIAGPALAQEVREDRMNTDEVLAPRGDIYDASGVLLATSVETYTLVLNLNQVPEYRLKDEDGEVIGYGATAAAQQLAPLLGEPVAELGARLVGDPSVSTGRGYQVLARGVSRDVWQQVRALRIPGLSSERTSQRVYPNGNLAGPLLGWVNSAGDGVAGLELAQQSRLNGTDGTLQYEYSPTGQVIPTGVRAGEPAVPGCHIHTTLNSDLQHTAQAVLDETAATYGAEWAAVAVVEIATGRVLALADSGSYDPNDPPEALLSEPDAVMSHAVEAVYEPGSTGKILTVLAALEEGVVTPTTPIEDPYRLTMPNGQTFRDHTEHGGQILTTTGVLAESANTGTINIGVRMDDQTRYEYMRQMGWGTPSGIGLPGDPVGQIRSPETWDGRTQYTTMFGQGLSVSLLQNTAVMAAIGNDGVHMAPRLIDGYTCDGEYEAVDPSTPVQVVSAESSAQMIQMLESVTEDGGTGTSASVEGFRIAGKTGTAQTADGAGGISATTASFVGVAPAEDPRFAVGVVVYKPTSGFFGGTIAAPIFHDVAAFALADLGVAPSTEPAQTYPLRPQE